jgi:hypothetical protein
MKRIVNICLWVVVFVLTIGQAQAQSFEEQLATLDGVSGIEKLKSDAFAEKYLVRINQLIDPKHPEVGTFTQRVVVGHVGYDRPTVLVTEGYGGAYAMNPRYQEELCKLFNANMVFVEYRYFMESTPNPCNWDYLTAENSAYDLHHVNQVFHKLYKGKWMSTGTSKGGQTSTFYRAFFPNDVDISVPYVAPLNRGIEDGRHEPFIANDGTKKARKQVLNFQMEVLKRKAEIVPMMETYCKEKNLKFRIPMAEVLDYCVLEYSFAFWQYGTKPEDIPALSSDTKKLFDHLVAISEPSNFAVDSQFVPFFVQAERELGYYGYDLKPFKKYLTIKDAKGFMNRLMLPEELVDKIEFRPALYNKVYNFLKDNDPKMIFIYGEWDPWSATRVPTFPGKVNEQIYIKPGGNHGTRISTMPEATKKKIIDQINKWLSE